MTLPVFCRFGVGVGAGVGVFFIFRTTFRIPPFSMRMIIFEKMIFSVQFACFLRNRCLGNEKFFEKNWILYPIFWLKPSSHGCDLTYDVMCICDCTCDVM